MIDCARSPFVKRCPTPAGIILLLTLLLIFSTIPVKAQFTQAVNQHPDPGRWAGKSFTSSSSMRFEENKGQVANTEGEVQHDILFTLKDKGMTVFFRKDGVSYQWHYTEEVMYGPYKISEATGLPIDEKEEDTGFPEKLKQPMVHTYRVDMQWIGSNENVEVVSGQSYDDYNNYYHAHCPDGITNVMSYAKLTYKNMYSGIDVQYYIKDGHLKYDVLAAAGADLNQVKFSYLGATPRMIDRKVGLNTPLGWLEEQEPVAWDEDGRPLDVKYAVKGNEVGFDMGSVDKAFTLDPSLVWGTYYGGSSSEHGNDVAVDGSGNSYLAGSTNSTNAIAVGGHDNTLGSFEDGFLVKFNASGVRQWGTYYGGSGSDYATAATTDGSGNIYLAGYSGSTSSIASGGHQNTSGGANDAFLIKFNTSGVRQWGTYYGGSLNDYGKDVVADGSGNIYLVGYTESSSAISSGGHQNTYGGSTDAFLIKFNDSGVRQWGTYYGGSSIDNGEAGVMDGSGNIFLAGSTRSTSAIAMGGHQNSHTSGGAQFNGFLVKFNSSGIRQWGTYYGSYGYGVAKDGAGNIYLTGYAINDPGIASSGHQNTFGGVQDAFLVKFNTSGLRQWGTFYGGDEVDRGHDVVADGSGNVYLAGYSASNSAIAMGGTQNIYGGGQDAFLVKFNASGIRQWGTYYGGSELDDGNGVAIDAGGNVYLAGSSEGTTAIGSGGHQNTFGGGKDAFLVKFYDDNNPIVLAPEPTAQPTNLIFSNVTSSSFTITYTAATGTPAGYLVVRKVGSAPSSSPVDGTAYSLGGPLGDGTIAYVGSATTFNQTGLNASTSYFYSIYSYNGSGSTTNYRQSSPLSGSQATSSGSSAQPTNLSFLAVTTNSFSYTWSAASPVPTGYLVLRSIGAEVDGTPVDGIEYAGGEILGNAVVRVGNAPVPATYGATGLSPATTYHLAIYSFNGSGAARDYVQVSPLKGSISTLSTEPTTQPTNLTFSNVTASTLTALFTPASGPPGGYLVLAKSNTAPTGIPVDGTSYTNGATLGDGTIAYAGSAATFNLTGLLHSTTYHLKIFSFNGTGGTINYRTTTPLSGSVTTLVCTDPPTPTITITGASSGTTTLLSSAAQGNQWYLNGNVMTGQTGATLVISQAGSYTVIVTVDGCSSDPSLPSVIVVTGDLPSPDSQTVAYLFPNPAETVLGIQLNGFKRDEEISIHFLDSQGREMLMLTGKGQTRINADISSLTSGLYIVQMIGEKATQTQKLIKR